MHWCSFRIPRRGLNTLIVCYIYTTVKWVFNHFLQLRCYHGVKSCTTKFVRNWYFLRSDRHLWSLTGTSSFILSATYTCLFHQPDQPPLPRSSDPLRTALGEYRTNAACEFEAYPRPGLAPRDPRPQSGCADATRFDRHFQCGWPAGPSHCWDSHLHRAARVGAVASLKRGSFYHAGDQWMLHFDEKGGKSREIPVRHDLEQMVFEYIEGAGVRDAAKDTPLFRTAYKKTGRLTNNVMCVVDVCRMVKRRLNDAGLTARLSPHSFRVTTITDLLEQGVPLEDVQRLAGHADPRTTRLYDRRQKKITRNIVERISI